MKLMRRILLPAFCLLCFACPIRSQYAQGVSGLLTIPSADMQADGTFWVGGNYLPVGMLPASFERNTGNYFVNLTILPFMEIGYRCTLQKFELSPGKYSWQQDRSVSLRLRVLKEKKQIPSLVVGSNDAFTTYELNPFSKKDGNRLFSSIYSVVSKTLPLAGHRLGLTVGYYLPVRKETSINEGFFGGIKYTPAFCNQMDVMADYNGKTISAGASVLFFRHVRLHLFTYGFEEISGGIRYEFVLLK